MSTITGRQCIMCLQDTMNLCPENSLLKHTNMNGLLSYDNLTPLMPVLPRAML